MSSAALLICVAAALLFCASAALICVAAALICVAAALLFCASAALTCAPTALPTCSPADLLSCLNSITGVFWGSVFAVLIAIVAINSGVPKPDKFSDEQVDLLLKFHLSAARMHYINAWM
jgi:hypothetical protein